MKPKIAVFFVDESNYKKLQRVSPGFVSPYKTYANHVEKCNRQASGEITPVKVYVDIDKFLVWCAGSKVNPDDGMSRSTYAASVLSRFAIHAGSFVVDN